MPTEPEHLAQFHHNVTVAERLFESNDWDWGVTALFYASLHLVQAYFVREGIPARTCFVTSVCAITRISRPSLVCTSFFATTARMPVTNAVASHDKRRNISVTPALRLFLAMFERFWG